MKKDTHQAISTLNFRSRLLEGCNPLSLCSPKQFFYSGARKKHTSWWSPASQLDSQSSPSQAWAPPPTLRDSLTLGNFCKSQPSQEKWWVWTINPSPERTAIKKRPLPKYSQEITVKNNNNELNICQKFQTCLKTKEKKGRSDQAAETGIKFRIYQERITQFRENWSSCWRRKWQSQQRWARNG